MIYTFFHQVLRESYLFFSYFKLVSDKTLEQQRHAFVSNVCQLKDLSWCRFCVILLVRKLNFLFYIFKLCWAFHWVPKPLVVDGCKFPKAMEKMDVATANQVCSLKLVNDVFFECRLSRQPKTSIILQDFLSTKFC